MLGILTTHSMANAKNCPFVKTTLSGIEITILFDFGASISAINQSLFSHILGHYKFCPLQYDRKLSIKGANNQNLEIAGFYRISFPLFNFTFFHNFYVVKNLAGDMICGIDFINDNGIIIDGRNQKI